MHPPCQPPPPPQCAPYTPPAPPPAPEPHAQVPSTLGEASGNGAAPAAPVENEVPLTPAPEDVAPLDVPTFGDLSDLILPVTSVVLAATCVIGLQQLGSLLGSISDAIKQIKDTKRRFTNLAQEARGLIVMLAAQETKTKNKELLSDINKAQRVFTSLLDFVHDVLSQGKTKRLFKSKENELKVREFERQFSAAKTHLMLKSMLSVRAAIADDVGPDVKKIAQQMAQLEKQYKEEKEEKLSKEGPTATMNLAELNVYRTIQAFHQPVLKPITGKKKKRVQDWSRPNDSSGGHSQRTPYDTYVQASYQTQPASGAGSVALDSQIDWSQWNGMSGSTSQSSLASTVNIQECSNVNFGNNYGIIGGQTTVGSTSSQSHLGWQQSQGWNGHQSSTSQTSFHSAPPSHQDDGQRHNRPNSWNGQQSYNHPSPCPSYASHPPPPPSPQPTMSHMNFATSNNSNMFGAGLTGNNVPNVNMFGPGFPFNNTSANMFGPGFPFNGPPHMPGNDSQCWNIDNRSTGGNFVTMGPNGMTIRHPDGTTTIMGSG